MKKYLFLLFAVVLLSGCNRPTRPEKIVNTYEELPDPETAGQAWEGVKQGFNLSFGSIDERYKKHSPPELVKKTTSWKGTGWKGERIAAHLVLWTTVDVRQVEFEVSDLKAGNDIHLAANVIRPYFVRYTMTDEFAGGCGYRKPENFASSLSADVLDPLECMDMEARSVRPVWISIDIPIDAEAGVYRGNLSLFARIGGETIQKKLDLQVEVLNRRLPPASERPFYLDLWQNPTAVARFHNVQIWSDKHFELMKPLMKRLADAGQKVITATLNKDPWNGQCYDRYADMILWTKKAGNVWEYDYTAFDKWVSMMMEIGVTAYINCYSMIPWNNELHYFDEGKKETINVKAVPGTPEFEAMWSPFIKDFKEHLKSKKWLEKTNIAMDERDPASMKATIEFLQKAAPELGIALADNHKSYKEYPFLKDISVACNAKVDREDLISRRENNRITTYYVCCADKFPNAFSFSAPSESAYIPWYAVAKGYDGFLRRAYNSWVENPLLDTRFRTWPAGDTNIVYPENRSSVRFERLLEGLQGVEKLRILREQFSNKNDLASQTKLAELEDMLSRFGIFPQSEDACNALVNQVGVMLNLLAK